MSTAMVEDSNVEDDQLLSMTTDDIIRASRLLDNEIRVLKVRTYHFLSFFFPPLKWSGFYSYMYSNNWIDFFPDFGFKLLVVLMGF